MTSPSMENVVEEDSEGFRLLSKVRTGLKREFQFALRSQNEFGGSLSRTRVRKSRFTELSELQGSKKVRKRVAESEEEEEEGEGEVLSDVVTSDEESNKRLNVGGQRRESVKVNADEFAIVMEDDNDNGIDFENENEKENSTAVLKESEVKKVPTKLRELLETGLLEGLNVKYVRKKVASDKGLAGIIKGCGVLCFCVACNGNQVITPNLFELHAGSANKRPSDYIYLENGRNLKDVISACKNAKLKDVEPTILNAISSSTEKNFAFCVECKEPISDAGLGRTVLRCKSCSGPEACQMTPTSSVEACERSGALVPLPNSSNTAPKTNLQSSRSQGKITLKDLRLHKLVFQDDFLPDGTELGYYVHGKKVLSGYKQGSGIFCYCCQSEVSPSQFEAHAGYPSRRKPYLNIYTSNGVSLHELSLTLSRTSDFSTDENDDLCSVCHNRGDLLCCDGCPRAFHTECVNLSKVPQNKWYCKYCEDNFQKERFAQSNPNAIAAGRVPGVDPIEQITNRCIRIVKIDSQDSGGCVICRIQDFCKTGFGPRTVIICDQCEKEYHVGCMREHNMQDLKELPFGDWFCCSACESINASLKKVIEEGEKKLPSHLIDMLKKKLIEKDSVEANFNVTWRVLNGRMSSFEEIRPLFAKAVTVFHEQFDPILYGALNQDLIPHLVYGKNLKEKELGGMCCAVISVNSAIVSCAVFRVFGEEIGEVPLVATCKDAEGKGYFQCLYSCMERLFKDLGVKNILLPAAEETRSLWMNKFGFIEMRKDQFNDFKKRYGLMNFDGTSMLHKLVPRSQP